MPIADSYGQNVPIATLTDPPNAQTLATGIVNNIVPKTVMTFASASVRGATLVPNTPSAPTEGMVSWLKDTNTLSVYNGSTWVTIAAGSTTWTKVTSLQPGWSHDGNGNGDFCYKVADFNGDRTIFFRGALGRTWSSGVQNNYTLNDDPLPANARPSTKRTIVIPCSDSGSTRITMKMDINPNGDLTVWGFGVNDKPDWIGFNGCYAAL